MAYEAHPEFHEPDGGDTTIWRYMDLAKFLSLLDKQALYFVRLDKLAKMDPFEGYYTTANLMFDDLSFDDIPEEWKQGDNGIKDEKTFNMIKESNRRVREFVKSNRAVTFVNSWHAQDHESAAMWSQYLQSHDGIAIQTTYKKLIASFSAYDEYQINVGMMKYIDYETEAIPIGNLLSPFMYKRKSFEHDREIRCLIWTPQHGKNDPTNPENNKYKGERGIYVPVQLDLLIERIYLAPTSPEWIHELVESLVKRMGLEKEVVFSRLASVPLY